jgi:hypothetical protein
MGPCLVARGERRGGAFRIDTTSAVNDGTVFSCTGRKEGSGLSQISLQKTILRRQYKSLDQVVHDMNLMFKNAKGFNEDRSELYKDAV